MSFSSRFLLASVLLGGLSCPAIVRADPPQSLIGAPTPEKNGFDSFVEATKLYQGGFGDSSSLSGSDLIRLQRATVARNGRVLRKIREGIALPVLHPLVSSREEDFDGYKEFRKIGQLMADESAVHLSDANWLEALNSCLDCIQFGILLSRGGPLGAAQAGCDIEEMGRANLAPIMNRLNIQECHEAAARLARIESLRPPYSDALRVEKVTALALTRESFEKEDWTDVVNETLKPNGDHFTESEKSILNNAGEDEILANLNKVLDEAIAGAESVYRPTKSSIGRGADPWSRMLTDAVTTSSYRIQYENGRAQNAMIRSALELRANKLQTGTYPATIELPTDPFANPANGGGKMKYRLEGGSYLLYSIGPNAKDDNGVPVVVPENGVLTIETKGDLVAPVYSK